MFPVSDDDSQRRTLPVVTYILIIINVVFFLVELSAGDQFIQKWAFIPARFSADPVGNAATILTAMFMHGGWLHLFSNMLFLWIFGDNVEDRFGHVQFLIFYLLVGLAATFAQFALSPESSVPNVGASGAIAGVLGSYILLFPADPRECAAWQADRCDASSGRAWSLDCFTAVQWCGLDCSHR